MLDDALHLGAVERAIGDLRGEPALERFDHQALEARAREGSVHESLGHLVVERIHDRLLELGRSGDLPGDALCYPVLGERARERVGQRAGQRPVDRSLDFWRRKQLVCRCLELLAALGTRLEAVGGKRLAGTLQRRPHDGCASREPHG